MNWQNRITGYGTEKASQLLANPFNWRIHPKYQQQAMQGVLERVGWVQDVIVNTRTGHIVDRHMRVSLALQADDDVPVKYIELDEAEEAFVLSTYDPIGTLAITDSRILEDVIRQSQTVVGDELARLLEDTVSAGIDTGESVASSPVLVTPEDTSVQFPSDNEFGIPLLDANMQADNIPYPHLTYGFAARRKVMAGLWLFYTDDYRFEALWGEPHNLLYSAPKAAVECNFSVFNTTPKAVALYQIYRKRWLARYWQSKGVRIFVDLNVPDPHFHLNLLGVPKGWRAYATRGYSHELRGMNEEYELACEHAGTRDLLYVCYGGGAKVKEHATKRGWFYIPEVMTAKRESDNAKEQ